MAERPWITLRDGMYAAGYGPFMEVDTQRKGAIEKLYERLERNGYDVDRLPKVFAERGELRKREMPPPPNHKHWRV